MSSQERGTKPGRPARKPPRSERLAAALRANLHRRKAQARGRAAPGEPGNNDKRDH